MFPTEVEDFIEREFKGRVGTVSCVGIPHEIFTEGIMAFIERKKGAEISKEELEKAVKEIASYKRPSHYEIIDEGMNLGPSNWSVIDGTIIQTSNIYGGSISGSVLDKPGTMAITGSSSWSCPSR